MQNMKYAVTEQKCGNNFEYIINNHGHLVDTDYKVLLGRSTDVFIPCMKLRRNGNLSLFYWADNNQPLSSMLNGIRTEKLMTILLNVLSDVIEIKANGFLNLCNVDFSWDRVYVDSSTLKVRLVYVPIDIKDYDSNQEAENELRASMSKLIENGITLDNARTHKFIRDLRDGSLSTEEVYKKAKSANDSGMGQDGPRSGDSIRLSALHSTSYFEVSIDKDEVVIGKKKEIVDAVIPFNRLISRRHCKINRIDGEFYISDEGSSNGTFVNGVRVLQGQRKHICKGDIVKLADTEFRVM